MPDILRIGTVISVDTKKKTVRVRFSDTGMTSDWITVIKNTPSISTQAENETENNVSVVIKPWMPSVNDIVLCIYKEGFNADGYVLGGL